MRNLISKRTGIKDHFCIDKYSSQIFKDNEVYTDIIKNEDNEGKEKYGPCMKNIYKSDEWIKAWIKCEVNKVLGKDKAYYVYNVDYEGIEKPCCKYLEEKDKSILYERANGVMYYDFDHIGKDIVEIFSKVFDIVSSKYKVFQWFETSWSGKGCHIRVNYNLKFKNLYEWQFVYMYYLDILMKKMSNYTDVSKWYDDGTIDWSCATITRGFAIPYNENGVKENTEFDRNATIEYSDKEGFNYLADCYTFGYWEKKIADKFLKNIGYKDNTYNKNERFINKYYVDEIDIKKAQYVDGEKFNYNWRLKCVTTLMQIYKGDKDKVRNACKYIYTLIRPYKNHNYKEMIGNELENKIFRNADFSLGPYTSIIEDLKEYFGFDIKSQLKVNEVYVNSILQDSINIYNKNNGKE